MSPNRHRIRSAAAVFLLSCATSGMIQAQSLATARSLARQGKADAAVVQTQGALVTSPKSVDAHELLCQLFRSTDHFDEAIHECEIARDLQPNSSAVVLELARTYGAKADHAGALTGMRMVGRIRASFERAAQLDPKSVEALSDLGEFYVEAPGLVGGGLEKARAVLVQLRPLSPARADRLAGMIAAKAGDQKEAETQFAAEIAVGHTPEAYVDAAVYQRKRKNFSRAESYALEALHRDIAHGPDTVDAAQVLIDIKRSLSVAETALRDFLAHEQPSAVLPAAKVHTMIGQLMQARGDTAGANGQYEQALALSADYEPARKALHR